jgi:hypothetical protein
MKEILNRNNRYSRGLTAGLLILLLAGGAEACDNPVNHSGGPDQHSLDLNNTQVTRLQKLARGGHIGMDAYKQMLIGKTADDFNSGVSDGYSVGPGDASPQKPFKLGGTLKYFDVASETSITVKAVGDVTEVVYRSRLEDVDKRNQQGAVFSNPDGGFFGADGMVSLDELKAFYKADATRLTSFTEKTDNTIVPDCDLTLTVAGNSIEYQHNGQDGCPNDVNTAEQFVDYSQDKLFY